MKSEKFEANLRAAVIMENKDEKVVEVFNAHPTQMVIKINKIKQL